MPESLIPNSEVGYYLSWYEIHLADTINKV